MYSTNYYSYGGPNNPDSTEVANITETVTNDYTTLNSNIFIGFTETQDGKIDRAFACGIVENNNISTPFCIEGTNDYSIDDDIFDSNKTILTTVYSPYNNGVGYSDYGESVITYGYSVNAKSMFGDYGGILVHTSIQGHKCEVDSMTFHCS